MIRKLGKNMELEKTIRMNILFSFYGELLTPKQAQHMADYYEEDHTLAEIADNHGVSRQAIYDSIKRAEDALINYEDKLKFVQEFENRKQALKNIREYVNETYNDDEKLMELIEDVMQDSIGEGN